MANEQHLKKLKQGVQKWNEWREANLGVVPDLSRADLSRANLSRANLSRANLIMANLIGADLSGAYLRGAKLRGAKLCGANLKGANLSGANLSGANLSHADLSRADLRGANVIQARLREASLAKAVVIRVNFAGADLGGADFTETRVGYSRFANVDLSTVKGIETIEHLRASTIGIDTIYRSKGKIPLEFLRGGGVPDNFIEYMGSLVGAAFEYYSCFISYSGKDQEFAVCRLAARGRPLLVRPA